jgi:NDP-sugar pyrophosphorylase family protein
MKAMIFAAGLGTRLYPITQSIPKALVEVSHKTLIEIVIQHLIRQGFNEIIVNLHHFGDQIKNFIQGKKSFGIDIQFSDEAGQLLDTGGGLKKASWFFDDGKPFLVHNVDVISDLQLGKMIEFHNRAGALATLAVRKRSSARYLYFDGNNSLCGWENTKTNERVVLRASEKLQQYAFSGIQVIDPSIFNHIQQTGKFSIIEVYLKLAASFKIQAYDHSDSSWVDVGKPDSLQMAEAVLNKMNLK